MFYLAPITANDYDDGRLFDQLCKNIIFFDQISYFLECELTIQRKLANHWLGHLAVSYPRGTQKPKYKFSWPLRFEGNQIAHFGKALESS